MDTEEQLRNLFTAAIPFVMVRQKGTGGFSATPKLPATIQDTYHALNILILSQKYAAGGASEFDPLTDTNLRTYLKGTCRQFLPTTGTGTTFQLLWSCRSAGVVFDPDAVATAVITKMQLSASLEDWYYGARILSDVLCGRPPLLAKEFNGTPVPNRGYRYVDEAWMHIRLSRIFGNAPPLPAPELIAWFQNCQNGDGGFGFFPRTTSFIENCYSSLRALRFLGAEPLYPDRASRFLSACQTASGGFGRSSRAAPFLDATWYALASLSLTNSIKP